MREISRRLQISRKAVKAIIQQQGQCVPQPRRDKIHIDTELLERLHRECQGRVERMHEKLHEEYNSTIGYSTLTRMLRDQGIGQPTSTRCDRVPDQPGVEMQHDTTVYHVRLGGVRTMVIASLLYLRYSKRRYLKFYRAFPRFAMKCFLHEALRFWQYVASICVIDNTNLARLRGAGSTAIIAPEMAEFARGLGFEFLCHAIRHPNRKAGNERSFYIVETNFLPGRTFDSLEDLNAQAFQWATQRLDHRPQGKARVIPAKLFEHEVSFLRKLPPELPAPYQVHYRGTDAYGYVAFRANYYWVPGTKRESVKLFEYADRIRLYLERGHDCLVEYPLPPDNTKNERFAPPGEAPRYQPKHLRKEATLEEQRLRTLDVSLGAYLDWAFSAPGMSQRHRFTRELFALSQSVTPEIFVQVIQRAHQYRVFDLATIRRIAWLLVDPCADTTPREIEIDNDYQRRPSYAEGSLTDEPDLTTYDRLWEETDHDHEKQEEPQQKEHDDDSQI